MPSDRLAGGARCDAGHTFEGRTNFRPKCGRVVHQHGDLGLDVSLREEGSTTSAEPAGGEVLGVRFDNPEVPARLSQGTVAIPAVDSKTEQLF